MSVESLFEQYFKPETKKAGAVFFQKGNVVLSNKSNTYIQAYIKGQTCKVSFTSESISSKSFSASCSCPAFLKGQYCKHIWAVLLSVETNYSDFLVSKNILEKLEKVDSKQSAFKEKQNDYRKMQYQKQKLFAKKRKIEKENKNNIDDSNVFPSYVEAALKYFDENGFPMERPICEDSLINARKKLARVFHPDVGGSHEETVALNDNFDTLIKFFRP